MHNARTLAAAANEPDTIIELRSSKNILEASGTGESNSTSPGLWGYLNTRAGWADATAALTHAFDLVVSSNRVKIITGTATKLLISSSAPSKITGVIMDSGETLPAALTILATGPHTPSLLDLRGRVTTTAQPLLYIKLSDAEYERLKDMPTLLSFSTGLFIIPPHGPTRTLKIAQHSYGYRNPTTIRAPFSISKVPRASQVSINNSKEQESKPHPKATGTITTSLPTPPHTPLPSAAQETLLSYLQATLPSLAQHPIASTRLCHYADTPTGDFLICYPPTTSGLFVATGGSGHGFKFLPVLGGKIVEVLEGRETEGFAELWAWRDKTTPATTADATAKAADAEGEGEEEEDDVFCEDGSRGGERGKAIDLNCNGTRDES
jgi:sarcosine oxidase/L-pipecolate oxidase